MINKISFVKLCEKKNETEFTLKFTLSYHSQNFEELLLLKVLEKN